MHVYAWPVCYLPVLPFSCVSSLWNYYMHETNIDPSCVLLITSITYMCM
jgi:hypothetical protein